MSRLVLYIMEYLGQSAYVNGTKLFKMYHSGMSRADLDGILASFAEEESKTRFLIATIAFGIGINIKDIRLVLHWGAPKTIEDYWQEVGRAGRDGKPAQAEMYATKVSLINYSKEIQGLVKAEGCYRQYVLDLLSLNPTFKVPTVVCILIVNVNSVNALYAPVVQTARENVLVLKINSNKSCQQLFSVFDG